MARCDDMKMTLEELVRRVRDLDAWNHASTPPPKTPAPPEVARVSTPTRTRPEKPARLR